MPLNLASPGILVKEIDLTAGRVDPTSAAIGAIVGPFEKGPVNEPVLVTNEQGLLDNFGDPHATDKQYETWLVASSYLAYGGPLQVVRSDSSNLKNSASGGLDGSSISQVKIGSYDDYVNNGYDENTLATASIVSSNPGGWANGIKVGVIDAKADQILSGVSTAFDGAVGLNQYVGYGVTQSLDGRVVIGTGSTSLVEHSLGTGAYLKGMITEVGSGQISVKVLSTVSAAGTVTDVDYQQGGVYEFKTGSITGFSTVATGTKSSVTYGANTATISDWFDAQNITLSNGKTIAWNSLADKPGTSSYAAARGARFDEVSVVVVDDTGSVTGNAQTILEKHLNLSKAKDSEFSVGATSYWRKYISENSEYIFALGTNDLSPVGAAYTSGATNYNIVGDFAWDQNASGITFGGSGNVVLTLEGGVNYNGQTGIGTAGALDATVGDLSTGYDVFANTEEYEVDFLLMGGAAGTQEDAQALASKVISVAEGRQDALAFVSPGRTTQLTETVAGQYAVKSDADITTNVVNWYSPIPSSSYAIFDSGYKYM